jgi:hypothetical protein
VEVVIDLKRATGMSPVKRSGREMSRLSELEWIGAVVVAHATPAAPYLGPARELVCGGAIEIEPNDWAIGGAPASVRRPDDVRARAAAHQ